MAQLDREKRIDLHLPRSLADPRFSTDYLFGPARGKMFGVMVCRGADGQLVTLKSFSGQYNGVWELEGWTPPLFDPPEWKAVNDAPERAIKQLGREIDAAGPATPQGKVLTEERKQRSQALMRELHRLYRLHNFRSQSRPLTEVYTGGNGIPSGTADCCAPKLLDYAARNALVPLGMAEFYYGMTNRRGTRHHRRFYAPCREKCRPILGFMLCGVNAAIGAAEGRRRYGD